MLALPQRLLMALNRAWSRTSSERMMAASCTLVYVERVLADLPADLMAGRAAQQRNRRCESRQRCERLFQHDFMADCSWPVSALQ
jgi:hypothetical protein